MWVPGGSKFHLELGTIDTTGADIGSNVYDDELVEDNADDDVDAEGVVNDTVVTDDEEVGDEEAKKIYELAADFTKKHSLEPRSASDTPDKFEDALREMMATVEECDGEDMDGTKEIIDGWINTLKFIPVYLKFSITPLLICIY